MCGFTAAPAEPEPSKPGNQGCRGASAVADDADEGGPGADEHGPRPRASPCPARPWEAPAAKRPGLVS